MTLAALILACSCPVAFLAASHVSMHSCVALAVLVSLWAMSDGRPEFFQSHYCGGVPKSAAQILLERDRFKMCGINATSNAAQMIYLQSVWDRFAIELVRESMSLYAAAARIVDSSISVDVYLASPKPATAIRLWADMQKESVFRRCVWPRHVSSLTQLRSQVAV